jgi:NADH:ubiquinone oxidoreductase subunit 6 (subunit J)
MEEKKPITHIVAGLIISAILIVYSIALTFLGLSTDTILSLITYAIFIGGIIVFINLYGKAKNNQVTFGNLFAYGFKTTSVIIVLFILFLVLFNLIFPDLREKGFEIARQKMEEKGKLTEEQIDQGIQIAKKFFWVGIIAGVLLIYAIVGAIASLIGAAVTKKKPVNPLDQMSI